MASVDTPNVAAIRCYPMTPDMKIARPLTILAAAIFVVAVLLFLIAFNVRWVINFPPLYSYGFDRYDIPQYTGIERDELLSAARQIRDYFNNDVDLLEINVVVRGIRVSNLYNEREVLHMRDVKGLVKGVYRVSEISALYLLLYMIGGFALRRRAFLPTLGRLLRWSGGITLGLVLLVGLGSLVGFDRLFLAFHLISFSNDLWQLDPSRDYLIAMFPQGFFLIATLLIAFAIIVQSAALVVVPTYLIKRRQKVALESDREQGKLRPTEV